MELQTLMGCAVLCGVIGLGAYSASCAVHVWRTRNARRSADRPLHSSRWLRVAQCAMVISGLGLLCMALAAISRVAAEREGLLAAEGLFTLRRREGFEVDYLTREGMPKANALLARFCSPEREAQIAVLDHRREALKAERLIITHRPLDPDPEITRRQQELSAEKRHLRTLLDQLIPVKDMVARELSRNRLTREEQIIKLDGELDRVRSEIQQADARRRLSKEQFSLTNRLYMSQHATSIEYITSLRELEVLDAEVVKLRGRLKSMEREKTEIQKNYPKLEDLALSQVTALDQEITRAGERLAAIRTEEQTVEAQLAADLSRAERQKQEQVREIDHQIQQCDAELSGLEHTLTIRAPFGGRLVYRNPSPSTALADTPLLVLAPAEGLRLRIRLASLEANALEEAGPVILEMVWQDVQRRFQGRLIRRRELSHDPGFVAGELVCDPPAEAARDLASNKTVKARLLWSPPLYNLPLFDLGTALAAGGSVGWLGARLRTRRGGSLQVVEQPGQLREYDVVNGTTAGIQAAETNHLAISVSYREVPEFGELGAVHRLLGSQLREAIIRRNVDPALLSAIEWALDRHHARAAQFLSLGLGDEDLGDQLESLVNGIPSGSYQGDGAPEAVPPPEVLGRLMKVLRAIAPEHLLPRNDHFDRPASYYSGGPDDCHNEVSL